MSIKLQKQNNAKKHKIYLTGGLHLYNLLEIKSEQAKQTMSQVSKKKFVGVFVSGATKAKLQQAAKKQDRSLSYVVNQVLSAGATKLERFAEV
jgi:hypothetical protein